MDKMRMRWEKKPEADAFAKARQYLRKVGDTINNHSNTLKMLPSSNDYASVFCGALNVFIKASSNYSKLSEEFGRAMTEINDSIATVNEQVLQHKDEIGMRHLVLRFYCQIFAFLINAMKWYTDKKRKRLLRSLNENLYSQYQEQILEQPLPDATPTYTRQQILLHSAHLTTFFSADQISPFLPSSTAPTFPASAAVADRIRALTLSPTSAVLHVRGPASLAPSTPTSRIAARWAAAARAAAGASVVSWFCALDGGGAAAPAGRTRETVALVAAAYAVVRQLVELLPEGEGRAFGALGPERFAAMDGTLRTWRAAMGVLAELLEVNDEPLLKKGKA
ncbi:hypothetical protein GTA08_BOTSDO13225 [Neofusicoccum parvum]|nr:hypothetical protein GTA08_BOTSDO13225 [Neofusicoccum parvum]